MSIENNGFTIVTIVKGRRTHLHNHIISCTRSLQLPIEHIIVVMDDASDINQNQYSSYPLRVIQLKSHQKLPLAKARNIGIGAAIGTIVVVLDVDCIVSPTLFRTFLRSLTSSEILSAFPYYLPRVPQSNETYNLLLMEATPHPERKHIGIGSTIEPRLFWSLAFAGYKTDLLRAGGFDENLTGYGAEDTDFAVCLAKHAIYFSFVDDKILHQYHEKYDPPLNHFDDIIKNATYYYHKHGVWPMEGWLQKFTSMRYIKWNNDSIEIVRKPSKYDIELSRVQE